MCRSFSIYMYTYWTAYHCSDNATRTGYLKRYPGIHMWHMVWIFVCLSGARSVGLYWFWHEVLCAGNLKYELDETGLHKCVSWHRHCTNGKALVVWPRLHQRKVLQDVCMVRVCYIVILSYPGELVQFSLCPRLGHVPKIIFQTFSKPLALIFQQTQRMRQMSHDPFSVASGSRFPRFLDPWKGVGYCWMITYHGSCASEVSPSMAKAQKVGDNFAKDVQLDEKSYDAFSNSCSLDDSSWHGLIMFD